MSNMTKSNTQKVSYTKAEKWHYIKVFCCFFSLISSFAALAAATDLRSNYWFLIVAFWGLGILSALVIAPGKLFGFAWRIIVACATFGWFLLPFPFDLATVAVSGVVGIFAALFVLLAAPAVFTIYTYFSDVRYEQEDEKKDILVALVAVAAVLLSVGVFFLLNNITKAIEKPIMENKFDAVQIYKDYATANENAMDYPADALSAPKTSTVSEDGYIRTEGYEFEAWDENLYLHYNVTVKYEYVNGAWSVKQVQEEKTPKDFKAISGTWTAIGEYCGNLVAGNEYTLTLTDVTGETGTGTVRISFETWEEKRNFTVTCSGLEEMTDGSAKYCVATFVIHLDRPLEYSTFLGQESIEEVTLVYSFADHTIEADGFTFLTPIELTPAE